MIILQVGQCGIQTGEAICTELEKGLLESNYPSAQIQQLLIDSEKKVISDRVKPKNLSTFFKYKSIERGGGGKANNFLNGFQSDVEDILDQFRKLAEQSIIYDGCLMVHSLAGGTGSGMGAKIAQKIRENYGKHIISTVSVAPFQAGETTVQSYNSLLSLAELQKTVDQINIFSNDALLLATKPATNKTTSTLV